MSGTADSLDYLQIFGVQPHDVCVDVSSVDKPRKLTDALLSELSCGLRGNRSIEVLVIEDAGLNTHFLECLRSVLAGNRFLKCLSLRKNHSAFGDAGAETLSSILASAPGGFVSVVNDLDVAYCDITDVGLRALCDNLVSRPPAPTADDTPPGSPPPRPLPSADLLCRLKSLNLSNCSLTQAAGAILGSAIARPDCCLVELDLSGNRLGNAGMAGLADGIATSASLLRLNVSKNSIRPPGILSLSNAVLASRLEVVNVAGNAVGDDGVEALLAMLKAPCLLSFNARACRLKGTAVHYKLRRGLSSLRSGLLALALSENPLGDVGTAAVASGIVAAAEAAALNPAGGPFRLRSLDLTNVDLSDCGLRTLIPLLSEVPSLGLLDVDFNEVLSSTPGSRGAWTTFVRSLCHVDAETSSAKLLHVNLSGCGIDDEAAAELAANVVYCAGELTSLSLALNNIGDDGVRALGRALSSLRSLVALDLSHNAISGAAVPDLEDILAGNPNLAGINLTATGAAKHMIDPPGGFLPASGCVLQPAFSRVLEVGPTVTSTASHSTAIVPHTRPGTHHRSRSSSPNTLPAIKEHRFARSTMLDTCKSLSASAGRTNQELSPPRSPTRGAAALVPAATPGRVNEEVVALAEPSRGFPFLYHHVSEAAPMRPIGSSGPAAPSMSYVEVALAKAAASATTALSHPSLSGVAAKVVSPPLLRSYLNASGGSGLEAETNLLTISGKYVLPIASRPTARMPWDGGDLVADQDAIPGCTYRPLVVPPHEMEHSLYPGFGRGRFSANSTIHADGSALSPTMVQSLGEPPLVNYSANESRAQLMFQRLPPPLRGGISPYAVHVLESNPGGLLVTPQQLDSAFDSIDVDRNGWIPYDVLKSFVLRSENFGAPFSEKDADECVSLVLVLRVAASPSYCSSILYLLCDVIVTLLFSLIGRYNYTRSKQISRSVFAAVVTSLAQR